MGQLEPVNMPRIIEDLEEVLRCVDNISGGIREGIRDGDGQEISEGDWSEDTEMFCQLLIDDAYDAIGTSIRRLSVLLNDGDLELLDTDKPTRRSLEIAWSLVQGALVQRPRTLGFDGFVAFMSQQVEYLKENYPSLPGKIAPPELTRYLTKTCIAEIFGCGRNRTGVQGILDTHEHVSDGKGTRKKYRLQVTDLPPGWETIVSKHAPKKRQPKK